MKNRIKLHPQSIFIPTLITIIFGLAFWLLPTPLKDDYNLYPLVFLLTIALVYLKLSFFLFTIFQNFTKNCTAFALLVILCLSILQLYFLSLARPFLSLESYPLNTFQFLGLAQVFFLIQLFLVKMWQARRLNITILIFYSVFWLVLFLRPSLELRWSLVLYQFISILGLILELFSFHQTLKVFLARSQNAL